MNMTFFSLELKRIVRDPVVLFFTVGLPAVLYLIFGVSQDFADEPINDGNVAMWIMIAMAAYGALSATTGIGGMIALERMQGWTRQLGLTPMSPGQFIRVKALTSASLAGFTIAAIYTLGAFTGAEAPLSVWIYSAIILMLSAMTFSLYGLSFGMAFKSESALSASGGSLVLLAFFGNMFFPLSGWQLTVAKFTPLYGYISLARRTLSEGLVLDGTTGELVPEPLWQVLANVTFWTLALVGVAFFLFNREKGRQ